MTMRPRLRERWLGRKYRQTFGRPAMNASTRAAFEAWKADPERMVTLWHMGTDAAPGHRAGQCRAREVSTIRHELCSTCGLPFRGPNRALPTDRSSQ